MNRGTGLENLALYARRDDEEWAISAHTISPIEFEATDESQSLLAGGSVDYLLFCRQDDGTWEQLHREPLTIDPVIQKTSLLSVFPNPTREQLTASFAVHRTQRIRIAVYDASGREISCLADRPFELGFHSVAWDGKDGGGGRAAVGIYLLRFETASGNTTRKITWLR